MGARLPQMAGEFTTCPTGRLDSGVSVDNEEEGQPIAVHRPEAGLVAVVAGAPAPQPTRATGPLPPGRDARPRHVRFPTRTPSSTSVARGRQSGPSGSAPAHSALTPARAITSPTIAPASLPSAAVTSRWVTARTIRGPRADTATPAPRPAGPRRRPTQPRCRRRRCWWARHPGRRRTGLAPRPPRRTRTRPRGRRQAGPGGGPARTPPGGQDPGLSHPPTEALPPDPGLSDPVRGAHQHRADRGAEALGEAGADRVEQPSVVGQRNAGGDVRIPQPGAVQVVAETVLPAQVRHRGGVSGPGSYRRRSCGCSRPPRPWSRPGTGRRPGRWCGRPRPTSTRPRTEGKVRMVRPCTAACAPSSARAMWACTSQTTSSPGATNNRTPRRLASEPLAVNRPASCPSSSATRSSSARIVGSSP